MSSTDRQARNTGKMKTDSNSKTATRGAKKKGSAFKVTQAGKLTRTGTKRAASVAHGGKRPSAAVTAAMSKRVSLDVPQIASRALLSPSQVTKELQQLQKRGLVVEVPDGLHPARFKLSEY